MASFSTKSSKSVSIADDAGSFRSSTLSSRLSALGSGLKLKALSCKYALKERSYFDLKPCKAQNEGPEIACSELFWATAYSGGGGPVYVSRHESVGRVELDCALINGHSSAVSDIAFSPFQPTLMATASADCTVKLWQLPRDGPLSSQKDSDAVATFGGFSNSVRTAVFHPTCDNILAVSGLDKTVTFLDCEKQEKISAFELGTACRDGPGPEPPAISNMSFNYDGSAYALACKDRRVRIVDPRLPSDTVSAQGVAAPACSCYCSCLKLTLPFPSLPFPPLISTPLTHSCFLISPFLQAIVAQSPANGPLGRNLRVEWCSSGSDLNSAVLTVSVATGGMRSIHMWDPRNWDAPLCTRAIDTAAGQLYPMYDPCTSVCYVAGKGDTLVRAYEVNIASEESEDGQKTVSAMCDRAAEFPASLDRTTFTGVCMLPTRLCDVRDIECARFLKLTTTSVVPASVTLARAEHMRTYFQDDIYGTVKSTSQYHTAEDFRNWLTEPSIFIGPSEESLQPAGMLRLSEKPAEAPKESRVSSFRAAKEQEERELREKEEEMRRLTALANVNAQYNKNTSMGTDEVDSDDNWGDDP